MVEISSDIGLNGNSNTGMGLGSEELENKQCILQTCVWCVHLQVATCWVKAMHAELQCDLIHIPVG